MIDMLALIATFFSAVATGFAALNTWRAPIASAKLSEKLRRDGDIAHEHKKSKLSVFSILMEERASTYYSEAGVGALNLIDVVFNDSLEVREAWAELYESYQSVNNLPPHIQDERRRKLLMAMAKDIGLAGQLRIDDFSRVYIPTVLAQDRLIKDITRQQTLTKLQSQAAAENSASLQNTIWPPKP